MANRRTRTRRSHRRRGNTRQVNTGVLAKLCIMLAVVLAVVLGVAIFFRVRIVDVQGNSIYSEEQILDVCGLETGDNLLTVSKAAVSGNIQTRLPYVQEVSVGRILPDTIVIQVKESEVAALVEADNGSKWYINILGRVLGPAGQGFDGQVIKLSGVTVTGPQAGQNAAAMEGQGENLQAALEILQHMDGTGLMDRATEINAEKVYDLLLLCGEQYEVQLGGTEELDYKLQYLQAVLEQLEDYQTGIIDLTFDQERRAHFVPWIVE